MRGCVARLLISVCAMCLISCSKPDPRVAALDEKIAALDAKQTSLAEEANLLKVRLDDVETSVISETRPTSASFAPDQKGFQAVHTTYGVFLVSLKDIKPYANGYKATFNL